jgi:hypothetical protein
MPKNFLDIPIKLNLKNKQNSNFINIQTLYLKIILNNFLIKQNFEFDVIECEGFCEKPGQWLTENF